MSGFLKHQTKLLFGVQSHNECTYHDKYIKRNSKYTNWVVGLSCFAYLIPSLFIFTNLKYICNNINHRNSIKCIRSSMKYEMYYFIIVTLFSFLGDYVYSYSKQFFGLLIGKIDLWTATGGVILCGIKIFYFLFEFYWYISIFNLFYIILCVWLLSKSRNANNIKSWRIWHSLWHLVGGLGITLICYQEILFGNIF